MASSAAVFAGKLTFAMLMANTVRAAKMRRGL